MRDILRRLQRGDITLDEAERAIEDREPVPSSPPMGTVVRREATRPATALVYVAFGLVTLELVLAFLFITGLFGGWDQRPLALILGGMFFTLGAITDIYRRGFVTDRLVVKRRRDKVVPRKD